jgi:hypothetical protein
MEGVPCATTNYAWHGGECYYDETVNDWVSPNADEICHYTTQYEYICANQNSDGNWVRDESMDCPEMIVYYQTRDHPTW